MVKLTFKIIFLVAIVNFIICVFLFLFIKYDMEKHFTNKLERNHEDYLKYHTTIEEKILYHGFRYEEHKIKTDDGYILTAFRIPGRQYENENTFKKGSVIINHGLLDASYTFLALGENECLPFILAYDGYDVWLTNNRGTIFSYEHEDPLKDSNDMKSDYWDFSFHELAQYDIIANIKYVKKITKRDKINYLCHSQGCTQFFIGYTLYPVFFEENVHKVATMGAVLNYKNINKLFIKLIKKLAILESLEYFGIRNIMSFSKINVKAFGYLCRKALFICKHVISSIIENYSTNNIEWEALTNMFYYQPGGSSVKNLIHWLQIIGADSIRQFDYGKEKNLAVYGSEIPPEYEMDKLKNMTIPIFITTTEGDPYCIKEDFNLMLETFTNNKVVTRDIYNYNHLDYLWSKNAHRDIYRYMIDFLNNI